jgi:hypothetical protein
MSGMGTATGGIAGAGPDCEGSAGAILHERVSCGLQLSYKEAG